MDRSEAFPSKYVTKADLITDEGKETPIRCHIAEVVKEQMPGDEGAKENVMYFSDYDKPFVLKLSNWMICENEWGRKSESWTGKLIELYWDKNVMFGSKKTGGRRIRIPTNGNGHNAPAPDRATLIESLKDLRTKLVTAGGTKEPLLDTDIDTIEKLQAQIDRHARLLADQLSKDL